MKPYNEYEKLRSMYEDELEERIKLDEDWQKIQPNDYVIFGNLMKDITGALKSMDNREVVLSGFGDETKGYTVTSTMQLLRLVTVAICLSAAMDKTLSDNQLYGIMHKYNDPHALDAFNQYKSVAKSEMQQNDIRK